MKNLCRNILVGLLFATTLLPIFSAQAVTISVGHEAIILESSGQNLIKGNLFQDNLAVVQLNYYRNDNVVYRNSLVDNANYNANDEFGTNQWNIGSAVNHYGDYDSSIDCCTDVNYDKICDKGRLMPGGSSLDEKPLLSY